MRDATLDSVSYRLFYWPVLPGRGELVRLVFEEAGVPYLDVARLPKEAGGGMPRIMDLKRGDGPGLLPYAPPILQVGDLVISQTAAICDYLGQRFGLVGDDEAARYGALQLQLCICDIFEEVHDVHHPVAAGEYYEDQKAEALRAATSFASDRLPRWLTYFERVIERSGGPWLLGPELSYADLSLFQLVAGLRYSFPAAISKLERPRVYALCDAVAGRERIAAYLASERRMAFNEHGIFRYYAELDVT